MSILQSIQKNLNAPKNQTNAFGKYKYRSSEDILEALKPLLAKHQYSLILDDKLELIGDRYYVKATASLYDEKMKLVTHSSAYAREELSLKGQQASQITGGTSSYARKYALNGLFLIDDSKNDPDMQDNTNHTQAVEMISPAQVKKINTLLTLKDINREKFKGFYKVASIKDMTKQVAMKAIDILEKR